MLIEKINTALFKQLESKPKRDYIGASSIGNPCERAVWYDFHFPEKGHINSPTTLLTFRVGEYIESMIISLLRASNALLASQVHAESKAFPTFQGNYDAWIELDGEMHVLEIKTASNSNFSQAKSKGVKIWRPQYYDQIQSYLGMSEKQSGILLIVNKDTSEIYEEKINFDKFHYELLVSKAKRLVNTTQVPERINNSPIYYLCKMCKFKEVCHQG